MRDFEAERIAYAKRTTALVNAGLSVKADKIARICQRHELESDEFYAREQKALRFLS